MLPPANLKDKAGEVGAPGLRQSMILVVEETFSLGWVALNPAVLKADMKIKNKITPRIRAEIGPKSSGSLRQFQSGPYPGHPGGGGQGKNKKRPYIQPVSRRSAEGHPVD